MHQLIGWLSERGGGGNFLNLLQKEEGIQKGGGIPSEKGGGGSSNPGGNYVLFSVSEVNLMFLC